MGIPPVAGSLATARRATPPEPKPQGTRDLQDWSIVRDQFNLSRDCIHLSAFYIASHPRPVREAIVLSAGIVCFDVRGMSPDQVVRRPTREWRRAS
ncbi:MAG TPA: hypothetical protein VEW47_10175 [Candidatus Dormibacteraeota bacterium]|nr:hypothetical protein [Candidatus Dormibacteraeota bacterium]